MITDIWLIWKINSRDRIMKMDILATFATLSSSSSASSSSASASSLLFIRSDLPSAPAPPFAWFLRGSFPGGCRTVPQPSGDPPWTGGWSRTFSQWGHTVSPSPTLGLLWNQMIRHVTSFTLRLKNNLTTCTIWDDIWQAIGYSCIVLYFWKYYADRTRKECF